MSSKKFKITNISRSAGVTGIMLDLGTSDKGQPKGIIHPNHFAIVSEEDMLDAYYGWHRNGYADIKQIGASIVDEVMKQVEIPTNLKVSNIIPQDDTEIGDDFDDELDTAMAVDAKMPVDGIVKPQQAPQASASPMGLNPNVIDKDKKLDATNPLLDETAKELDNSGGKFTATAPVQKNQTGSTIRT